MLTSQDITGLNRFDSVVLDQPVLYEESVRYEGDAIAVVAADTLDQAREALKVIDVDYEPLAAVGEADTAEKISPLQGDSNLVARDSFTQSDSEAAFARCALVEHHYKTPRQMHACMGIEGGVAIPDENGGVILRVGCQFGHRDVEQLADILGLKHIQVAVEGTSAGRAFVGTDELAIQPVAGILAIQTGAAVLVHLDRFESCRAGTKRQPVSVLMTTGCHRQDRLLAHRFDALLDTGAYASLGPAVLENFLNHVAAPLYRIEANSGDGRLVYINNGVSGAFCGVGGNHATLAVEFQLDALAGKLAMCPLEFRRINLVIGPGGLFFNRRQILSYPELVEKGQLGQTVVDASQAFPVAPAQNQAVGCYLQLQIVTVARVAVDLLTGRDRVTDLYQITAVGCVIYPPDCLGQIKGAAIMGLGMTLTEDIPTLEGRFLADDLDQYMIPAMHDVPDHWVDVLDNPPTTDSFPVLGVDEPEIDAMAPSICSAIESATGIRIQCLPVDPGYLLSAICAQEENCS